MEQNLLKALKDLATLTELCAMILYQQSVTHPYMCIVRAPGTEETNVLDLGPLHAEVRDHIEKILENPELLVSPDASHVTGSLDGKEWEDPEAVKAVFELMPELPYLKEITIAFLRGALTTWIRFSSEFAPGGLIDEASATEQQLAWMPSTNDANEGALGAYRVAIRGKPNMTLHQYNALAMYQRNETQAFIDIVFTEDDHIFVMREARRLDASGLETKRRREIVDFRVRVAKMRQEKELSKRAKKAEDRERIMKVKLISCIADIYSKSCNLTIPKIHEQFDALRLRGVPEIMANSRYANKSEKQKGLEEAFRRYEMDPALYPLPQNSSLEDSGLVIDDWEVEEEVEMGD